jgi:hypothetical protein
MSPARKRGSPGAEVSKNGTSANKEADISAEDTVKLMELGKEMATAELVLGTGRGEFPSS